MTRFLRETFALICLFAIIFTSTASISARTQTITPTNYGNGYGFTAFSFAFGDLFNPIINFFGIGANQITSDEDQRSRRLPASPLTETDAELNESARMPDPPTVSSAAPCTPTMVTLNVPGSYATIQAALNAANPLGGDAIQVAAGTYTEQLVITKCVSIIGAGQGATFIQSPAALAPTTIPGIPNIYSIVEARSGAYVNMSDLTVQGPVPFYTTAGPFASSTYGIFVAENATLEMDNARVTAIHKPSGIDGVQNGNAVQAGRMAYNQIGSLDFDNVTVDTYQKTGVLVDRTGSSAIIANSTISGIGPTTLIAMNGIQVSRGASATVTDSTISGHEYTPINIASSAGILPFNSTNVTATGNTFNGNDVGIYHFTSPAPMSLSALNISTNTFTNNPDAGIIFDAVTPTITDNFISGSNWGIGAFPVNGQTLQISRNSISAPVGASSVGIYVDDYDTGSPTTTATINANFTRITGHTAGIQNDSASAVNAVNNFWGCNTGPGGVGCDTVAGTGLGLVTFNPWLVLNNTTSSVPSVNTGGTATVTTNLRFNSAMVDTFTPTTHLPNAILSSPNGIPVNFSSNAFGSVTPASAPLFNGQAQTTFTGGGPFPGNQTAVVTAAVDNATDSVNITVLDTTAPTVTIEQAAGQPDPANAVPVNFTAVFSEAVTGFTSSDISTAGSTATIPGGNITVTEIAPMDGTTYTVAVSPTTSGFVTVSIPANAAIDSASNGNAASTSSDNTVSYFVGTIELIVDDDGMASAMDCNAVSPSYNTINGAVAAASAGYIIRVCPGTYPLASTVNVGLTNLTIIAAEATKPVIEVSGTMDGFNVTATGVTLEKLEIVKIGTGDQHHMVRVQANDFTGKDNYIHGPSWQTPNHVSRAYIFNAGVTGFLIDGNTIEDLRQPAYSDNGSGTVSNNSWTGTKGWVNDGGLVTFTNNTMTTCAACDTDIALLNNANPAYQTFYANRLALSNANNNAHIDVQFTPAADSGRATSYVNKTTGLSTNDGRSSTPYQSIQQAIFNPTSGIVDGTLPGGTVNVAAGTYNEDVTVDRTLNIIGAGAATTTVSGPIGGGGSTFRLDANNVDLSGFTITRAGNNTTDWNDPNLNTVGVSIQGQAFSGNVIHDNIITGNRNGVDVNNTNGHTFRNNVIDSNRTGMIYRNQTDNSIVVENTITNNFTVGILFLDGSVGSNVPVQTALNSSFINNNLSGNWYGQIVDRQTGGSLPAAGDSPKNFQGNWFGTATPVVTTANSAEPGYAAQIPVIFGGTATAPGGQPDIAGAASANFRYNQVLTIGTDTNVETATGRGTFGFQGAPLFVNSQSATSWFFFDDFPGMGTGSGDYAIGPAPAPLGSGSARLTVDANGRQAFGTVNYRGIRLDRITKLQYSSYQTSANSAATPTLQFDVDSDLTDGVTGYQGRLVYEPNMDPGNTILQNQWQTFDAFSPTARFWGSGDGNPARPFSNSCPQSAPCDLATILSLYPNIGLRAAPTGTLLFKAGGPTGSPFVGYVDKFEIGISTGNTTFDFEPGRPTVTINQAAGQNDPTNTSPINFTAVFSTAVTGFTGADVTLSGTAGATTAVVTEIAPMDGTTYNVAVSGMTTDGTVIATIVDSAATANPPSNGGPSLPSTSTDNTVNWDQTAPTVTINQASGQADPTNVSPVNFTAVFNEAVTGFTNADVLTTGSTAGIGSIVVTNPSNDNMTFEIAITATSSGFVIASIPVNSAIDSANNGNAVSTSTDNSVSYFSGAIELVVDDLSINCLGNAAPVYNTINGAVAAASAGYIIRVCPGTYPLASTVNVALTNLTIIAAQATKPVIEVGGTMDGFNVTATGVTLEDLEIVKIGTGDQHHMIRVLANNFTGKDNYIHGPSWQMPNHVSRAFIIAPGITGFLIDANVIEDLRQPAYTDPGTVGTVSNNTWTGTKGWVNDGGLITFTNNTMTTCAACDTDIALLNNADPAYQTFYANRLALSNGNNNAHIDVQFTPAADSGRATSFVNKTTGLSTNDGRVTTPYQSIQQAVFNPASGIVDGTLPGGTVNVAAGTYIENLDVSRQLTVLGPNEAINPNTGSRVAEAIITTAVSDNDFTDGEDDNTSTVVRLNAEGIIFKGFTVDGDNTLLNSGYTYNGADLDAFEGIVGTGTNNPNLTITNNIVKNMGEFGIDVWGDQNTTQAIPNLSTITDNKVDNVVGYFFGWGIFMGNNAPGTMTGNVVTRSFGGLYLHHFNGQPASRPASTVSGNNVSVYGFGVWFNLHYAYSGTPNGGFTVSGNTVNSYTQAPENGQLANQVSAEKSKALSTKAPTRFAEMGDNVAPFGWDRWIGVRVESINGLVPVTFSNNTIAPNRAALVTDGYTVIDGFRITNPSTTTALIDITGNSINGAKRGIAHTAANAVPEVSCNNITNNEIGIYIGNGVDYDNNPESAISGILANNNNLLGNSLFGVQADSGTSAVNNAQMNYWGAADGPGPIGPGTGDKVSANVDFTNFLIAPTNCTPVAPPPTVTINQAMAQLDPTNASPINFTVVFSESVTGFGDAPADVVLSGTAGATTAVVTGSGTTYNVAVSGMATDGTVIAMVAPGAATGANGANVASTSTDNTVTYDTISPTVSIEQAAGQNDPTNMSPINFTVVFNEPTTNFITGDVTLGGTAGATTATVTQIAPMDGTTYNVAVSGMTMNGTVIASIAANAATDTAGNGNAVSTSTDNTVTFDATNPTPTVEGVTDPDSTSPVDFTVDFGEPVTGLTASDVTVTGSAFTGTPTVIVTGGMQVYNVAVSGMNQTGNVVVTIAANSVLDASNNPNNASIAGTPNGNDVQFNLPNTAVTVNPTNTDTAGITDWSGFDDNTNTLTPPSYISGPTLTPPAGVGSARLNTTATGKYLFFTTFFNSASALPLSQVTNLRYSSYAVDPSNAANLPSLQMGIDFDSTDMNTGFQGRLVFEPANNVTPPNQPTAQNQWQNWDATNGRFWFTQAPGNIACGIASPCSMATVLATYPNINIPNTLFGFIGFRSTGGGVNAVENYVDNFVIGINSTDTTFNFEPTPPTVSIGDATVAETNAGTTTVNFNVSISQVSQLDTTVTVSTADGTATVGDNDYAAITQNVTILAGQTSAPIAVTINGDATVEPDENFTVNLSNAINAAILDGQGSGTISNDDVIVGFCNATYSGAEGTPTATITVCRNGVTPNTVTVNYATSNGTAFAGSDYTAASGTLSFGPNDTTMSFTVPITDDIISEGPALETVNLALSMLTGGAVFGTQTAILSITDNDGGGFVTISGNIKQNNAPNPNTNLPNVTVTLIGGPAGSTVTDVNGNYSFTNLPVGISYQVTPSGLGKVYDPVYRNYSSLNVNVNDADFVAYNNLTDVLRKVRVGLATVLPGNPVTVPVKLDALGNENGVSFNLSYNTARLNTPVVTLGADAAGSSLIVNTLTPGTIIVALARPPGQTFGAAGVKEIVNIQFQTVPTSDFNTPLNFNVSPRSVNDTNANPLLSQFINGFVVYQQGLESDVDDNVTNHPDNGDNDVDVGDFIEIGQYAALINTPDFASSNEFQRADIEPTALKGDADVDLGDFIQAGRYAALLDPLQAVGGPAYPIPAPPFAGLSGGTNDGANAIPRIVRVVNTNSSAGSQVTVSIEINPEAGDLGASFTLDYDVNILSNPQVALGSGVSGLLIPNTTIPGKVIVQFAAIGGMPAGLRQLATITFNVSPMAPVGMTPLTFSGVPVVNDVRNSANMSVTTNFNAGNVNILGPLSSNVSVAGQVTKADGTALNNVVVKITDQNGATRQTRTTTFGNYRFDELEAGQTYTITVNSKRFTFKQPSRVVTVNENLDGFDFVSIE